MIQDFMGRPMVFLLVTLTLTIGLMNIMNTLTQPPHSLSTMVYSMVTMFLVVTTVQLCQLSIMAILSLKNYPVLLLSVIVINSLITIKLMLVLRRLADWLWVASKVRKKWGLGKQTVSGDTERWSSAS